MNKNQRWLITNMYDMQQRSGTNSDFSIQEKAHEVIVCIVLHYVF